MYPNFIPPTVTQHVGGKAAEFVKRTLFGAVRWLFRAHVIEKMVALPFLVWALGFAAHQTTLTRPHALEAMQIGGTALVLVALAGLLVHGPRGRRA